MKKELAFLREENAKLAAQAKQLIEENAEMRGALRTYERLRSEQPA